MNTVNMSKTKPGNFAISCVKLTISCEKKKCKIHKIVTDELTRYFFSYQPILLFIKYTNSEPFITPRIIKLRNKGTW